MRVLSSTSRDQQLSAAISSATFTTADAALGMDRAARYRGGSSTVTNQLAVFLAVHRLSVPGNHFPQLDARPGWLSLMRVATRRTHCTDRRSQTLKVVFHGW